MSNASEEKFHRRRVRSSYVGVVVSISLVLFAFGLQLFAFINADKLITEFKESLGLTIYLNDGADASALNRLQKVVAATAYCKTANAISREEAAKNLEQELGEDFMQFLQYNPLPASIEVKVHAPYASTDSLAAIQQRLLQLPSVGEVIFKRDLIENVQSRLRIISVLSIGFVALLFLVAVALINSSIRLGIYSKRFLIKSMILVGATSSFVRGPFVRLSLLHGTIAAMVANSAIAGILFYADRFYPSLITQNDLKLIGALFAFITAVGLLISWLSTTLAVRKYIRARSANLY